jgi:hypothetical protein
VKRVPLAGGEKTTLQVGLDRHRDVIEETARHAGHMDIARELIDGSTGEHPE